MSTAIGVTVDKTAENLAAGFVADARKLCGCFACSGLRPLGGHTIMAPDNPRDTPSSCLASNVFDFLASRHAR